MPFVGGARIGTVRPVAIAPKLSHSKLSAISLEWSPGQGMRPPPGHPVRRWGLYLSAGVHKGHALHIDEVKLNKSARTVTIRADARGQGAGAKGTEKQEKFVGGSFPLKAEKWTVVVKDSRGTVLAKKSMMLGGPPAP